MYIMPPQILCLKLVRISPCIRFPSGNNVNVRIRVRVRFRVRVRVRVDVFSFSFVDGDS